MRLPSRKLVTVVATLLWVTVVQAVQYGGNEPPARAQENRNSIQHPSQFASSSTTRATSRKQYDSKEKHGNNIQTTQQRPKRDHVPDHLPVVQLQPDVVPNQRALKSHKHYKEIFKGNYYYKGKGNFVGMKKYKAKIKGK